MGLYHAFIKKKTRGVFDRINEGDYEALLAIEDPRVVFNYAGAHALGSDLHNVEGMRLWYQRAFRLFPGIRYDIDDLLVHGGPTNTLILVQWTVRTPLSTGEPYEQHGVHLLRIKNRKCVEIRVFLDTQKMEIACRKLAEAGVAEAGAPPITDADVASLTPAAHV